MSFGNTLEDILTLRSAAAVTVPFFICSVNILLIIKVIVEKLEITQKYIDTQRK